MPNRGFGAVAIERAGVLPLVEVRRSKPALFTLLLITLCRHHAVSKAPLMSRIFEDT